MRTLRTDRIGEGKINNQGIKMVIIAYKNINDIDVEFEDGYIAEHKEYKQFLKGGIRNPNYVNPNGRPHKNIDGEEHKYCGRCREWKSLDEFGKDKRVWDKLKSICRKCENTYVKVKPNDRKLGIVETKEIDGILYKKCTQCGEWKPSTNEYFRNTKKNKIGLESKCRQCMRQNNKKYEINNKDKIAEYRKKYRATPQGQTAEFNHRIKTRLRKQNQGNGITKEQWLECMKYFNFKCAYSGKPLKNGTRSIDHIKPLNKGGEHDIWNLVPMYKDYNSSKQDKDLLEWYQEQDFYSEKRLNKIYEWQKYAHDKWVNK